VPCDPRFFLPMAGHYRGPKDVEQEAMNQVVPVGDETGVSFVSA